MTTLVSANCQPPAAGYNLVTSVDKYYKAVKDSVTWQSAKAACSSDGTMLVELRTAADYQAIRPIFGKVWVLSLCLPMKQKIILIIFFAQSQT